MFENIKVWLIGVAVLATIILIGLRVIAGSAERPARPEKLAELPACPTSPNCVSSASTDPSNSIDPLSFEGDASAAFARLRETLTKLGGNEVLTEESYLWFEFRTTLFGFVDDVECLLDTDAGHIEIRSASRIGHSDLGANRKRVERIRMAYPSSPASI